MTNILDKESGQNLQKIREIGENTLIKPKNKKSPA